MRRRAEVRRRHDASTRSERSMQSSTPRQPYATPALTVYGTLAELTLAATVSKNKNDSLQGMNNLKT
jgi:hypothetical protein